MGLRQLHISEFRHADCAHHWPPLAWVWVWRWAVKAVVEVILSCCSSVLTDLRLAVHKRIRSAVGIRVTNVEVPHRVAVTLRHGCHGTVVFLAHDTLVVRCGTVRGWYQDTVALRRHIVRPCNVTACDAWI